MNQIPPESPDNTPGTPTPGIQPQDSSDLESRMARLVGLEEESPSFEEDSATQRQSSLVESQEPQDVQTQQPLSSNPFAKLGVVGAATLSVVVVAGVFLTQLINPGKPSPQSRRVPEAPTQPRPESRLEQLEKENETLRAKLALTEQAEAVKQAQQQLRRVKITPLPRVAAAQPSPRAEQQPRPSVIVRQIPSAPVVRTEYRDRIVRVEVPVRVPQRPVERRTPQTRTLPVPPSLPVIPPPVTTPSTQPTVEFTPTPTPDPLQEWTRLAKLGSYGQVSTPDNQSTNNATIAQRPNTPIQRVQAPRPPIRNPQPSSEDSSDESSSVNSSVIAQRRTKSSKSTVVGSSAKARLVTAMYGEFSRTDNTTRGRDNTTRGRDNTTSSTNSNNQTFVVKLESPLKAEDGSVVVPANAELHTQVRSISEKGLPQFEIVRLVVQEKNGNRIETTVPKNALSIRGSGGKPPVFKQFSGQRSAIGSDAAQFFFGGAQKAGEIINRPQSDCSDRTDIQGNPYRYCTQENPDPNILAGVLDGGFRNLGTQITQRSQQTRSQNAQRNANTNIWWLKEGTQVEVFVNTPIQL